jgi:bifunctional UDP-N-acetylglucosamine pyrophosphorylase/glucosamine-1-phosphate N-acetyltransferase
MTTYPNPAVVILAAGQGKRMRSDLPKVLHEVGGLPMLFHILRAVREAAPKARIAVVVGHGREKVEAAVASHADFKSLDLTFVHQPEQRGTGHAARCAMDSTWGAEVAKAKLPVLVLPGDLPLMPTSLVTQMIEALGKAATLRLLTCELPDPTGYGRIVRRGKSGPVLRIVEERDANLREKAIREVAASIYLFQSPFLQAALHRLSNKNAQGEYYLTDLVALAARARKRVDVLKWPSAEDLRGVNDPWELAQAGVILNQRVLKKHASTAGVRFVDPASTWVDVTVEIGEGTRVEPGALLQGSTRIGRACRIGAGAQLKDTDVGDGAVVKKGTVSESSQIGPNASVGPYAHLRPESSVGAKAKIGNFVELKKTRVGANTSIAHLSYLGDAEVGERVNIGCGFVTCNFDGRVIDGSRKHKTIIEDDAFVGSDCQTIAPVQVGKGAYVASGSTITENVEPGALAIARSRQVNKPGYARKLKG